MVLIDLTLPPSANQRLIPYVINMTRRIIGIKDSSKYRECIELAGIYDDDSLIEFLICRRLPPDMQLAGIRVGVWTVDEHNPLKEWSLENAD
ncbi:MAG: hypothetical protein GX278_02080 [Aeromonadales bacterium]|nr:hypothetical protein [Aeromonadales bacterium]